MLFSTRYKELYLTNDTRLVGIIQQELEKEGISYKIKNINSGTQNRQWGTILGQLGEQSEHQIMYYIYVQTNKYEISKKILKNVQSKNEERKLR